MNALNFSYEITKGEGCIVKIKRFESVEEALMELKFLRKITTNKISMTWKIEGETYTA